MVQFKILSGKLAGSVVAARRFPFQIGRAPESDLALEEPGVWPSHLEVQFEPRNGFIAVPHGEALITVNGERASQCRLRNGDRIEMGGAALEFWLGETGQRGLLLREWTAWGIIALVAGFQVWLLIRLL
jgi:pSer/pThr/pTyr-binding forkhead associated (FHA) protein